jgi:Co/Zn/Cd efflux system component
MGSGSHNNLDESLIGDKKPPNNQYVLGVTALCFLSFVIAEIAGALYSHSLSLIGDAAAMMVDVFTYAFNMYAERVKSRGEVISNRARLIMEVYIPSLSVCALIGVTAYITQQAVIVLLHPNDQGSEDVNILMLWLFSSLNALVDIASLGMFCVSRDSAFTYNVDEEEEEDVVGDEEDVSLRTGINNKANPVSRTGSNVSNYDDRRSRTSSTYQIIVETRVTRVNLNMASAFTHVGGDSLRTVSVFVAALVATVFKVPSSICDAWATVAVGVTIVAMVIPLIIEICKAARLDYKPTVMY